MTEPDIGQQFEELWEESASQAGSRRCWCDMTLREKKVHSSRFRQAMERYGLGHSDGTQVNLRAFASAKGAKKPTDPSARS